MDVVTYFSFVLNAVIIIVLLLFSRENMKRVKNILDILSNGAYSSCPFFKESMENGRRQYDKILKKGGEEL